MKKKFAAFSLVELSIVLVILGLLVGGILAGQSLIRAAQLRSGITQMQSYVTSLYAFRDKYFSVAGDMSNASSFWSGLSNGNADRLLSHNEGLRTWTHLAAAGMIEGTYTGAASTAGGGVILNAGENVPIGKVNGTGYHIENYGYYDMADTAWYGGEYGNAISYGKMPSAYWRGDPAFTPEEAWNMDTKIDDGKPGMGRIVSLMFGLNCGDTVDEATAAYKLSVRTVGCVLFYRQII